MKWQEILKFGGTGTVSVFFILTLIFNLSGVEYSHSGDIYCETNCESYVYLNTTYWNICFEHSSKDSIVYRKTTKFNTLWINLNKVSGFVPTNPSVRVELQVPTVGNKWRDIKDGDCITRNKKPNKIKIVGTKEPDQTVKWSFILSEALIKDIKIDPMWYGTGFNITQVISCVIKQVGVKPTYNLITVNSTVSDYGIVNIYNITKVYDNYTVFNATHYKYTYYSINGTRLAFGSKLEQNGTVTIFSCIEDTSYITAKIGTREFILNYPRCNYNCSLTVGLVECDSCIDGNCNSVITSGETGFSFNKTHFIYVNGPTKEYEFSKVVIKGQEFRVNKDRKVLDKLKYGCIE